MISNKNIVVVVTGGIAAYKSVDLVSRLKKKGANVKVMMTYNAQKFVTELSFRTLSHNPVYTDMFERPKTFDVEHIALAEWADLFIIAPATANIIGKIANGIADDLITTTIMATKAQVLFAPAMNTNMYLNEIVQNNIKILKEHGYEFVDPGVGKLACEVIGPGRMAEPEEILNYINKDKSLIGKNIIVTAGPTREEIDPVRYISNYSSGKMGYEIAKEAFKRGANVTLISGPTNLDTPYGIKRIDVISTEEMLNAIDDEFENTDILIKAAAPSDFKPRKKHSRKIKKELGGLEVLELIENQDIAKYFGDKKGDKILVGFAAETENLEVNAKRKLQSKNLDFIVANDLTLDGAGFNVNTNIVSIIDENGIEKYPILRKKEVASIIINKIIDIINIKAR